MKLFFLFLGAAAWQDLRTRSIGLEILAAGAIAGLIVCAGAGRSAGEIFLAMIPGAGILLLSFFTDGMMGEGDGLFFLVSGLFLEWQEVILLFISGQIFCSIFGLTVAVSAFWGAKNGNIRKMRLPFLPFLLPMAMWMAVMRNL